jgi:hypothetical protein
MTNSHTLIDIIFLIAQYGIYIYIARYVYVSLLKPFLYAARLEQERYTQNLLQSRDKYARLLQDQEDCAHTIGMWQNRIGHGITIAQTNIDKKKIAHHQEYQIAQNSILRRSHRQMDCMQIQTSQTHVMHESLQRAQAILHEHYATDSARRNFQEHMWRELENTPQAKVF